MKVKVVKPLKKILLKTKDKTLYVGQSFTIKKSVVPSNTGFKTVVWSSSSSAVAKVNASGKVTAKAVGDAKITAKAVDGSGTKAVCKVKVLSQDAVNISSVRVLSANTVRVSFDKDIVLDKSSFSVVGKLVSKGTYNKYYTISKVRNQSNKVYDLRVKNNYTFEKNSFVKVSVNSLPGNGVKSLETEVSFARSSTPKDVYALGKASENIEPVLFDLSEYATGSLVYEVGNLPDGIHYTTVNNTICFHGKPTRSYFGKTTVISATDENEKTIKANVFWYIGAKDAIVGYAKNCALLTNQKMTEEEGTVVRATGGSGQYKYSFIGLPNGLEGNESTGVISGTPQTEGKYTVRITVSDVEDESRKMTVSSDILVEQGVIIRGKANDLSGKSICNREVEFTDSEELNHYIAKTNEDGEYSIRVAKGTYDGKMILNTNDVVEDDIYEWTIDHDMTIDFTPDCFQVTLNYDNSKYQFEKTEWTSNGLDNRAFHGTRVIYVSPGFYDISAVVYCLDDDKQTKMPYVMNAEFTVQNDAVSVNATVSDIQTGIETPSVDVKKES